MKTNLLVLAAAAVYGLAAQESGQRLKAEVPFAFEARGVKMASGSYTIWTPGQQPIVRITNNTTGKTILLMAGVASDNPGRDNALEFKRYNDVYFLSALKVASSGHKIALPSARRETEMAIAIQPEVILAMAK